LHLLSFKYKIESKMNLIEIDRRSGLTREDFEREYLKALKPVVFTDLMDSWPAKSKWTVEYFKEKYGHLSVPVYSPNYSKPGKGYMEADKKMSFRAFLDHMEQGPSDLRMFLFNIFRHAPELCHDFTIHTIMDGFFKEFPFMFFGGQGSSVALHYDIDLAHVFLNQIYGRKRVVLFSHEESINIYQHPYTVASYIDVNNPDYEKYPALKRVQGYDIMLMPGETLFMPSGYWHYIEYTDFGYSISLRSNESTLRKFKGLYNIATHFLVDKGMNKIMGPKWREIKANLAKKRAEGALV
jgi:hypothetical protein